MVPSPPDAEQSQCAVHGCGERALILQRMNAGVSGSGWFSIPLCGAHFLVSESSSRTAFLARYVVDGVDGSGRLIAEDFLVDGGKQAGEA